MTINKTELIKQLRSITQAPMNACKDALTEAEWDLEKATDIVKVKGLQQTSRSEGKVAAEGRVVIRGHHASNGKEATLIEINSQTDFVANSPDFIDFTDVVGTAISNTDLLSFTGDFSSLKTYKNSTVEEQRKELMALTKENIVIRRWFRLEVAGDNRTIRTYLHSNNKLGVAVSFETLSDDTIVSPEFNEFADNVAMQIAAMNPMVVSLYNLSDDDLNRQKSIFEQQLIEAGKPAESWPKIIAGKMNKWFSEACLLDQESVNTPKTTVGALANKLGVKILEFIRVQVGDGIEVAQANLTNDVADLIGA